MAWLKIDGVLKEEHGKNIVNNVSFEQNAGEHLAIVGESGSGKTTLLKIVGGHAQASSGKVHFEGKRVWGTDEKLLPGHPGIAYLSQHYELRNNYWVHEIMAYANTLEPAESAALYALCQIDHLLNRRTNSGLSGGEKQRIALARLLSTKPRLLLLDEPFSNLDLQHKTTIKQVLRNAAESYGLSYILVSHEGTDVLGWAHRIIILKDGKIVQQGNPQNIYHQPLNTYCAGLFGSFNRVYSDLAVMLTNNPALHASGGFYIIRPENLQLVKETATPIQGSISHIEFRGSHYLLEISTDNGRHLIAISQEPHWQLNEQVYLIVSPKHCHPI